MKENQLNELFWPIFFELLFLMLAGTIDTLMLSSISDSSVGAVGTANTYLSIFIIMFSIISTGMVAVITQYIGAGQTYIANKVKVIGILLNGFIGTFLSIILCLFSNQILTAVGIAPSLIKHASIYMTIVGGASVITALIPIYSNYLRSFGHTRVTMIATITSNVLNLILNSVFLFICNMGVVGIAIATVISKILNLLILIIIAEKKIKINTKHSSISTMYLLKQVIKIGLPAAAESALYDLAMVLIIRFLNQMDSDGINVTARAYVSTLTNFSYCAGAALAQSNAIIIGWNMGKHNFKKCYSDTFKALKKGIIISIVISMILIILSKPLLSFFTTNTTIINLATKLLVIDIFLEIGRVTNLIFANALKTAGDAVYIVIIASIVMLTIGVGGTYFLGIQLKYLAIGAYISMALDECIRGIISIFRWSSKKWETKVLV